MVLEKVHYNPPIPDEFRDQKRTRVVKEMRNKINKMNYLAASRRGIPSLK